MALPLVRIGATHLSLSVWSVMFTYPREDREGKHIKITRGPPLVAATAATQPTRLAGDPRGYFLSISRATKPTIYMTARFMTTLPHHQITRLQEPVSVSPKIGRDFLALTVFTRVVRQIGEVFACHAVDGCRFGRR